jgi:hypothetical protein
MHAMRKDMAIAGRLPVMVLAGLILAACASKETRIETALTDVGVPPRTASCMARDMAPKVTTRQLRNLQRATGLTRADLSRMTLQQALERLRAIDDPQLVEVAIRAGLACVISGEASRGRGWR